MALHTFSSQAKTNSKYFSSIASPPTTSNRNNKLKNIYLSELQSTMSAQPPFSDATVLDVCFALDDIEMEIKYSVPKHCRNMPALIFIHGSFHSSWCWYNYLQYFSNIGYPCVALILRGTSKTTSYNTDEDIVVSNKVKIDQHVHDVLSFLEYISGRVQHRKNTGKQYNEAFL